MLISRKHIVLIALPVLALALVGGLSWVFSPCHDPNYQQSNYAAGNYECASFCGVIIAGMWSGLCWIGSVEANTWIAWSTFLLVVVTGLLVWVAYQQFTTTRAQLRAYVFIEQTRIESLLAEQKIETTFIVKNFGQTPAYRITCYSHVFVDAMPLTTKYAFGSVAPALFSDLGPGATTKQRTRTAQSLTSDEFEAIKDGKRAVYLYVQITYTDSFARTWTQEFWRIKNNVVGIEGPSMAIWNPT